MTIDTAKERRRLAELERLSLFGCWVCEQVGEPMAHPAGDLARTPNGNLTCEDCWDYNWKADDPRFSELVKFDPFAGCLAALDVIDAQAAEIERLRGALRNITSIPEIGTARSIMRSIARAALSEREP